jgi:hypothetical protein
VDTLDRGREHYLKRDFTSTGARNQHMQVMRQNSDGKFRKCCDVRKDVSICKQKALDDIDFGIWLQAQRASDGKFASLSPQQQQHAVGPYKSAICRACKVGLGNIVHCTQGWAIHFDTDKAYMRGEGESLFAMYRIPEIEGDNENTEGATEKQQAEAAIEDERELRLPGIFFKK